MGATIQAGFASSILVGESVGMLRRSHLAVLVLAISGAATVATWPAARLAIVNAPSLWFSGQIITDIVYDPATEERLDLYLPPAPSDVAPSDVAPSDVAPSDLAPWPVVVFLQLGLVVERVDLRGTSMHKHEDHTFCLGSEMRLLCGKRRVLALRCACYQAGHR